MSKYDKIKQYMIDNEDLFEVLLNILLVWKGARKATLVESANYGGKDEFRRYGYQQVLEFVKLLSDFSEEDEDDLYIFQDQTAIPQYPRFIVIKGYPRGIPQNDEEMGVLLGFYCPTHDYGNFMVDRIALNIMYKAGDRVEEQLYGEFCQKDLINMRTTKEFLRNKIRSFNRVMRDLGLDITFKAKISLETGLLTLIKKVQEEDIDYIWNNYDKYINYFYNFGNQEILSLVKKSFNTRDKIEKGITFYKYLVLFTRPRGGVSLLQNFEEIGGTTKESIKFLKTLKPGLDDKEFKSIILNDLFQN